MPSKTPSDPRSDSAAGSFPDASSLSSSIHTSPVDLSFRQAQQFLRQHMDSKSLTAVTDPEAPPSPADLPKSGLAALQQLQRHVQVCLEHVEAERTPQAQTQLETVLLDTLLAMGFFELDAGQAFQRAFQRLTHPADTLSAPRLMIYKDRGELWFGGFLQGTWPLENEADQRMLVELGQTLGYDVISCDHRQLGLFGASACPSA